MTLRIYETLAASAMYLLCHFSAFGVPSNPLSGAKRSTFRRSKQTPDRREGRRGRQGHQTRDVRDARDVDDLRDVRDAGDVRKSRTWRM